MLNPVLFCADMELVQKTRRTLGSEEEIVAEQEITKDNDGTYHWNTFIVPFLNDEVLPDVFCGMSEEYISRHRESLKEHGIEHWKTEYFPLIQRSRMKHEWSFGVSERVLSEELKQSRWSCSWLWKNDNEELCFGCRDPLCNQDHGKLCRDQPHDHSDLCCVCHINYHDRDEPCVFCRKPFYDHQENCAFVAILKCGHEFHVDCIKTYLRKKNICPICKTKALITTSGRPDQFAVSFF